MDDNKQQVFLGLSYSSPQAAIATLIGGPMAAGFVLFHNLRLTGRRSLGLFSLLFGTFLGILVVGTFVFLVVQNMFLLLSLASLGVIGFSFLMAFLTDKILEQGTLEDHGRTIEASWYSAVAISVSCAIFQFGGAFSAVLLLLWYFDPFRNF